MYTSSNLESNCGKPRHLFERNCEDTNTRAKYEMWRRNNTVERRSFDKQYFLVQQPWRWLVKEHNYKCIWLFFLTLKLFPRFQSYYSHLQQMEYIAIAPCIKWRVYPSFALDKTFPKALLLLTWLIPKCPTAEVQIQSNTLHFHDVRVTIATCNKWST